MKIGYGTYGLPEVPVWEALPRLAALGYESVELCVADRWPTAPRKLSTSDRERLRSLLVETGLEPSAFMLFLALMAPDGDALEEQERLFREACELARQLAPDTQPVIVTVLGPTSSDWDTLRADVADRVTYFGGLAAEEGCRLALEPHVNALLDRPERVTWLMERVHTPTCGLNFDISHFAVANYPRAETIAALAPYSFHTHVKDGRMEDGKVRFLLPGEGGCDYAAYFREMAAAGYEGSITVEITAQIFNLPEYEPWRDATFSLKALQQARAAAFPGIAQA
jgi:sugar phosphate isomerase/epimerase